MAAPLVRIGELARRAGLPATTLRAWERRYGIVEPTRTESGYRLYSERDEQRLREMLALIERGAAPAEAAERVLRAGVERLPEAAADRSPRSAAIRDELFERLIDFDGEGAHRAIDEAVAAFSTGALLGEVVLPVLRRTGELWESGEVSVAEEHFISNLLRGRLMALSRGWGGGAGPLALLACPPAEEHDIGLLCFGLALRERGWRIAFLGADTPFETLAAAAQRLAPERIVLPVTGAATAELLAGSGPLGLSAPVAIGGAAAGAELAAEFGAELLEGGVIAAAEQLAATVAAT